MSQGKLRQTIPQDLALFFCIYGPPILNHPGPAAEMHKQMMTLPLLHGDVQHLPNISASLMVKKLNFAVIRPKHLLLTDSLSFSQAVLNSDAPKQQMRLARSLPSEPLKH